MEPWVVATGLIFLYLIVTLVLGVVANRMMTVDMEDFLLYGRRAGFIVLYLTVVASFHSVFAFLGSGGFFYTHGVGFWAAGTWTLLVGAITYVIGTRIWALGKAFGYMTQRIRANSWIIFHCLLSGKRRQPLAEIYNLVGSFV